MNSRTDPYRALVALTLLSSLMGCQIINKLTGRNNDSGTRPNTQITSPLLSDVPTAQPVIGLPNPTVSPLANQDVPGESADSGVLAMADASAEGNGGDAGDNAGAPTVAVVDAGTGVEDDPRNRRRGPGYRTYCKTHPGQVNPYTGVLCPMTIPGVVIR